MVSSITYIKEKIFHIDYPGRNFELEANSIEEAELWVKNLNIIKTHIEG